MWPISYLTLDALGLTLYVAVLILVYVMLALGLNIVVGYAGLLDLGYVAFFALGAYAVGWFASDRFSGVSFHFVSTTSGAIPGIHINFWLVLLLAGSRRRDRGRDHRLADATAPRRLPGDRHARLRRDHPGRLPQRGPARGAGRGASGASRSSSSRTST